MHTRDEIIPIKNSEPASPRYIHINPKTNYVHLLVPVVGGQEISTDNTCQAREALIEFFEGGALKELTAYKTALELDIQLTKKGSFQYTLKEERLTQICIYIDTVGAMQRSCSYREALFELMKKPSNLYGIQLRPLHMDVTLTMVNPVFSIEGPSGPSYLFSAMYKQFPKATITALNPHTTLIKTIADLPRPKVPEIQKALTEHCKRLFDLTLDFTKSSDGKIVDKKTIDELMAFNEESSTTDYVEALLGMCAPHMWDNIQTPLFYNLPTAPAKRTEYLSILTQFFLAHLNIYCKAQNISAQNFGAVLDKSSSLSDALVTVVASALSAGDEVEERVFTFFNEHRTEFGLSRSLKKEEELAIKQKFERTYRIVTATKENPHMDDFFVLDKEATGEHAKFVTHQGAICVNFAEMVESFLTVKYNGKDYFAGVKKDFASHPVEIPHKNECVTEIIDVSDVHFFKKMPEASKKHLATSLLVSTIVQAMGDENRLQKLLKDIKGDALQLLFRTPKVFIDFAGRIFHCTMYEYAHWAKNTSACKILEHSMNMETKAYLLTRIEEMKRIDTTTGCPVGLAYQQEGKEHSCLYVDLTPLKIAFQRYADGYESWVAQKNEPALVQAMQELRKTLHNVPGYENKWAFSIRDGKMYLSGALDYVFGLMPEEIKKEASPNLQVRSLLDYVAKGQYSKIEYLLQKNPKTQALLQTQSILTDYSNRTFNCTAYEYAYWAKDTRMCQFLERHMDKSTKSLMSKRIEEMERVDLETGLPIGLVYHQYDKIHRSVHFDLTPMKTAMKEYLNLKLTNTVTADSDVALVEAQHDIPINVAQEYCDPSRPFKSDTNFDVLKKSLELSDMRTTYLDTRTEEMKEWFPISTSTSKDADFTSPLFKSGATTKRHFWNTPTHTPQLIEDNLNAIDKLDHVRSAEMMSLRRHLSKNLPFTQSPSIKKARTAMPSSVSPFFEKPSETSKFPEGTATSDKYASGSPGRPGIS